MTWQYNGAFFSAAEKTKLNGVEAAADVTDSTNVDAAGATMESDIPDQSFINILENGDFESWSAGVAAAPDGWSMWHGTVAREGATKKLGTDSVKVTATAADASLYIEAADHLNYASRNITFACWVWSDGANQARLKIYDGSSTTYSPYHSGGSGWELLTVSVSLPAAPTKIECNLMADCTGGNDFGYFDGAILVEGVVCPAFSPKPLVDDGQSIEIDSATNQVTIDGTAMNGVAANADVTGSNPPQAHGSSVHADRTRRVFVSSPHILTGARDVWGVALDPDTDESVTYMFMPPKDFASFSKLYVYYSAAWGFNNWVLDVSVYYAAAAEPKTTHTNNDLANVIVVSDTDRQRFETSGLLGSLDIDDVVIVHINRDANHASDTNTADIIIHGVMIEYTADM